MSRAKGVIALLPALLVAADYFAARWSAANPDYTHPATVVLLALVSSQLGLLAVWCGLSRRGVWVRLPVTLLGIACVGLVMVCARGLHVTTEPFLRDYYSWSPCRDCTRGLHSARERVSDAAMGLAAPLVVVLILGLLRWRRGLSLAWNRQLTRSARKPLQFTTSHLLLAVTALATLLGVVPWLADQPFARLLPPRVVIGLLFVLVTLGSVWASLGQGRAVVRFAVQVPAAAALAFAMIWPVRMAIGGLTDALSLAMAAIAALSTVLLGSVLLIFRLRGYGVTRAEPSPRPANGHAPNLVAVVVAAALVAAITLLPGAYHKWRQARAADAILAAGGWVRYENGKVTFVSLNGRDKVALRSIALFTDVQRLTLRDGMISDDDLVHLEGLNRLEELDLSHTQVTSAGMQHLSGLRRLKSLNLDHTAIDDPGLPHLKPLKNLEKLSVSYTRLTDAGMQHLTALSRLRSLEVYGTRVTHAGLNELGQSFSGLAVTGVSSLTNSDWETVDVLRVLGAKVGVGTRVGTVDAEDGEGDAILERVGRLSSVQHLVCGRGVTDNGLKHLGKHAELSSLSLSGSRVTDAGLQHLAGLKQLEALNLSNCSVNGEGLRHLEGLNNLRTLSFAGTQVTDSELVHVSGLTPLGELDLSNTSISSPGLRHLAALFRLHTLDLTGTQVSDRGLAHLAGMTSLKELTLAGTQITDEGLAHLSELVHLSSLDLSNTNVTGLGVRHLRNVRLASLNLSNSQVSDDGLADTQWPRSLEELDLSGTSLSDGALESLQELAELASLDLSGTKVTGRGISHLRGLTGLYGLNLSNSQVCDSALADMQWPEKLSSLDLSSTSVSDTTLMRFTRLKNLSTLRVGDTPVTGDGLRYLRIERYFYLDLSGTSVSDTSLEALAGIANLATLDLSRTNIKGHGLRHLRDLRLWSLNLSNSKVTDEGLAGMQWPGRLSYLYLGGTSVSDASLEALSGLAELSILDLSGTRVTGRGLSHLSRLGLSSLNLSNARISDDGLADVRWPPDLRELDVSSNAVSDVVIESLKRLIRLESIGVSGTWVTLEACQELQKAWPTSVKVVGAASRTPRSTEQSPP